MRLQAVLDAVLDYAPQSPGTYTMPLRVIADGDAPSVRKVVPFVFLLGVVPASNA
jgi:hypothetical protein